MQIEEAIGDLKYYIGEDPYFNGTYEPVTDFEKYCYNNCKAIDTVLNELEKKEAEIDKLRNTNKDLLKKLTRYSLYKKEFARLNKQLEKKDKVIYLMAKKMAFEGAGRKLFSCDFRTETGKCDENGCESCIKKYYKKKAEEK